MTTERTCAVMAAGNANDHRRTTGTQPLEQAIAGGTVPHQPKWRVLLTALKATTQGPGDQPSVSSYRFTTLKPIPYQIDGEVKSVDLKKPVTIDCAPAALATLG
jgi:diacylglycerol kinase family enzyme